MDSQGHSCQHLAEHSVIGNKVKFIHTQPSRVRKSAQATLQLIVVFTDVWKQRKDSHFSHFSVQLHLIYDCYIVYIKIVKKNSLKLMLQLKKEKNHKPQKQTNQTTKPKKLGRDTNLQFIYLSMPESVISCIQGLHLLCFIPTDSKLPTETTHPPTASPVQVAEMLPKTNTTKHD